MVNIKKVLFLVTCMSIGGAEKVLIDLVNNLNPKKYDITVLMIYKNNIYNVCKGEFEDKFNNNIKIKYICNNDNKLIYTLFNFILNRVNNKYLYKLFIGNKYDIEVAFYEGLPTKFISYSTNVKSKKIAWLHTDATSRVKLINSLDLKEEKRIYSKYNKIIAVSKTVEKSFYDIFGKDNDLEVKYNPINIEKIKLKAKETISFGSANKLKLCTIGRLTPIKGFDRLLDALEILKNEGFEFELWFIGDGEEHLNLEEKVKRADLQTNVKFVGFQTNPYKYISKCDLVICSSFAEGYSTSILEAIVLEKPIITTECSGMKEIFGDKQCGIICNNSTEGLYNALKQIFSDKEKLMYFSQESTIRSKDFNLKNTIYEIEKVFNYKEKDYKTYQGYEYIEQNRNK